MSLQYTDTNHKHAATSAGSNPYQYDSNGNMKKRAVAGQTLALEYDAENRLVKVCQDTSKNAVCDPGETVVATFLYDGDGKRVQSIINGVATTFVGNHYEVSGSTVTKYYMAGTDRVAMRTNSTLNFLLGDHPSSALRAVPLLGAPCKGRPCRGFDRRSKSQFRGNSIPAKPLTI